MEEYVVKPNAFGKLLDKIVNDIFDSSTSDSSTDEEILHEDNLADTNRGVASNNISPVFKTRPVVSRVPGKKKLRCPTFMKTKYSSEVDAFFASYNPEDFKQQFKISKETLGFIYNHIKEDLSPRKRGNASIPPFMQVLLAMRKMSSSTSLSQIEDEFDVKKETLLTSVRRVVQSISNQFASYILWPEGDRLREICHGFQTFSRFPKVIGALESFQINLPFETPHTAEAKHASDRCFVQLQLVSDHEGRITHCAVGDLGIRDKQKVFDSSDLHNFISNPTARFPDSCHLVAGPGFHLHENVMVSYSGVDLTSEQQTFNEHLAIAHSKVIAAFSRLKSLFPHLGFKLDINRLDDLPVYLRACCVVHNICVDRKDYLDDPVEISTDELDSDSGREREAPSMQALEKRDALCKQLYMSKEEGVCFV